MKAVCVIVQSIYDFDPRVKRKAEALFAAGYSVDVLALQAPNRARAYTLNGVNVYTIGLGKKRGSLVRYLFEYAAFFLWAFAKVPLLMRRKRYAVVDVNTLPDFLIFAPIVARWMGARLVLDMHEITPEFYMSKYGISERSIVIRLLLWLEKVSIEFADHVLTITEPIEDLLVKRGLPRTKSTIVMNAVDEARFATRGAMMAGKRSDVFAIMYHGTLTRMYGLDIAVEAFERAWQDMRDAELWILGSGPELPALQAMATRSRAADAIKIVGQVPSADIPMWLERCDLGILPFRRDVFLDFAFPNKLPEFIVAGKSVLIARLKTIRHYFSEDAVMYFEPNDPADLADQMRRLYSDRDLLRRLPARAAEEYQPIRWDVMKQRYLAVIDRMCVTPQPALPTDGAAGRSPDPVTVTTRSELT